MIRRSQKQRGPRSSEQAEQTKASRDAWLEAARRALIEEGTAGVEINKLAKRLNTSRSVFYWLFRSRNQLLDELLEMWVRNGTVLFERIVASPASGLELYEELADMWVKETEYDPRWDGAIRDWGRTSKEVLEAVRKVDSLRINAIEKIFRRMGYDGKEAHIRARVMYYHQVGYYALGVVESQEARRALLPYYRKVLTGRF